MRHYYSINAVFPMSKSLKYWTDKYDQCTKNQNSRETGVALDLSSNHAWKSIELLAEYAGFYKHSLIGLPHAWGGQLHRFFTGRWNTHHGNKIQAAIGVYYEMDSIEAVDFHEQTTKDVLNHVYKKLGNVTLNPNGDLAKIFDVIKTNTGLDYFAIAEQLDQATIQQYAHS